MRTVAQFLAMLDVYPDADPAEFDRLQRELCDWWGDGGSCRAFVELHKSLRAEVRSLPDPVPDWRTATSWQECMAF